MLSSAHTQAGTMPKEEIATSKDMNSVSLQQFSFSNSSVSSTTSTSTSTFEDEKRSKAENLCKEIKAKHQYPLDPAFISFIEEGAEDFDMKCFDFKKNYEKPVHDSSIKEIKNSCYKVAQYFFFFSNEENALEIIEELDRSSVTQTGKLRIALIVGESNILSLLPEISKHADVILCNDIDPRIILHIKHMLNCMNLANTPEEFTEEYKKNNPLVDTGFYRYGMEIVSLDIEYLTLFCLDASKKQLKEKSFLYSTERFTICKKSLQTLYFAYSNINLFNVQECNEFASTLKKNNASIQLINVTNLHMYDVGKILGDTLKILLTNSEQTYILYSYPDRISIALCNVRPGGSTHLAHNLNEYNNNFLNIVYSGNPNEENERSILYPDRPSQSLFCKELKYSTYYENKSQDQGINPVVEIADEKEHKDSNSLIKEFIEEHKSLLNSHCFTRTNLKPYHTLTGKDILDHAKNRTFFGSKNRTRLVLEKMGIMNKNGDIDKKKEEEFKIQSNNRAIY